MGGCSSQRDARLGARVDLLERLRRGARGAAVSLGRRCAVPELLPGRLRRADAARRPARARSARASGSTGSSRAGRRRRGAAFLSRRSSPTRAATTAVVATNLAYPLGDLLLIALVVGGFALTRWLARRAWALIGSGLGLFAIADAIYLYRVAKDLRRGDLARCGLGPRHGAGRGRRGQRPPRRKTTRPDSWPVAGRTAAARAGARVARRARLRRPRGGQRPPCSSSPARPCWPPLGPSP